jgi:hypothetical protein
MVHQVAQKFTKDTPHLHADSHILAVTQVHQLTSCQVLTFALRSDVCRDIDVHTHAYREKCLHTAMLKRGHNGVALDHQISDLPLPQISRGLG